MNPGQQTKLVQFLLSLKQPAHLDPRERWYERSYAVFARASKSKNTPAGLVEVMAYAGSWVNLIPPACPTVDQADVDALAQAFDNLSARTVSGRRDRRLAVIQRAEKAFGTSGNAERVVLLSKGLHFFRPELAPMIDRRVGLAWDSLRESFPWLRPTSILNGLDNTKRAFPTRIDYLAFWEAAHELVNAAKGRDPRFNYRWLDQILFRFGKRV